MSGIMADQVPYPFMTAKDMKAYIMESLMYKFRDSKKNPELAFRIEAAYKQLFGTAMLPESEDGPVEVQPVCLHGTPGVGKTSSIRAAAKDLAKILGMRLVIDPVPPYRPQPNDLLISTVEMSGEISNIIMGGIPIADNLGNTNPIKYMNKLPLYQLAIMSEADAGILLLDDFVNAAPIVQNTAMSIALEGRFQMLNLGNSFVALTANLGALDNSDVSPLSDPMTNRIGHFYVEDTIDDFIDRMSEKYVDEISDAGICAFLRKSSEHFMLPTDSEHRGEQNGLRTPFPSPRSWEKLINVMRVYQNRVMNKSSEGGVSLMEISKMAQAFVGKHSAGAYAAFCYSMMTGADPFAKKLIETGQVDEEVVKNKLSGIINADQHEFAYQLAFSLASYASNAIKREPEKMSQIMDNYSKGLSLLDMPTTNLSINEFGAKLARSMPDWRATTVSKDKAGINSTPPFLNDTKCKEIISTIMRRGQYTANDLRDMAAALIAADRRGGYGKGSKESRPVRTSSASATPK